MPSFDTDLGFNPRRGRFRIWSGAATAVTNNWFPFVVPRNASWLYMIAAGGGAGGGGGLTAATSTVKSGGGGGGSGAMARILVPAMLLPKDLYVCAGTGGAGSTGTGVAGSAGNRSFVSCNPNSVNAADLILESGHTAAAGGPAGTSSAAAGGAAETIATAVDSVWAGLGIWTALAGIIGGASSITANSPAVTWGVGGIPCSGGTGGAGATALNAVFNGGNITGAGQFPTILGGTGVVGGPGNPGNPGVDFQSGFDVAHGAMPWGGMGGTGGGSSASAGAGGVGGTAVGYCSGGGGGGAGVAGAAGGHGAQGFVFIAWF